MAIKEKKYRPLFTAAHLARILELARTSYNTARFSDVNLTDRAIIQILAPFIAKIDSEAKEAAYVSNPSPDLLSQLGSPLAHDLETIQAANKVSHNAACYSMYLENPARCTLAQIAAAREHMYVNDLMSPEQEALYESGEVI